MRCFIYRNVMLFIKNCDVYQNHDTSFYVFRVQVVVAAGMEEEPRLAITKRESVQIVSSTTIPKKK